MTKCITLLSLCISILSSFSCKATILATGDATTPYTFSTEVNAKTYDFATGTLYLGLIANPATAKYIISKVSRPVGSETPEFIAIGANVVSTANDITYLTLATYTGNRSPLVIYTQASLPQVSAITNDGAKPNSLTTIKDAANDPQQITGDIRALAANRSYAFAAVPPANGDFGAENSGVAVICVKETDATIALTQTEQTLPDGTDPQVRAKRVDPTIDQVTIKQPPLDFPTVRNFATLHWSEYLQRLYIGLNINVTADDEGGKAVIVGHLDTNGFLNLENIAPDNAIGAANNIVAVKAPATDVEISIPFIRTMLCSTGPSYLIVSGGDLTNTNGLTRISALPLVDTPDDIAQQGTLADVDAALSDDHRFTIPATAPGQMPQYDDQAVMVGNGPLAMVSTMTISDIEVIGDTVYVAIQAVLSASSENGVLYSQALFDDSGKIVRWTDWTKRAFPYRGFCDNTSCTNPDCTTPPGCNAGCQPGCTSLPICDVGCQNQGVLFFAVDAVNGKVWAVDGTTKRIVRLTYWDRGGCISQLPCKVSEALCDGCYSVLDLDQATRGFSAGTVAPDNDRNTTQHRYALFGGCNKVVFARVSEAIPDANEDIDLQSSQAVISDFSGSTDDCTPCTTNKENFLLTTIADAGCINQLEYSRQPQTALATNYFFAGTNNGLYVFADTAGNGFELKALTTLNQSPFSAGSWHAIQEPFNAPIVAIKTTGKQLYVITRTIQDSSIKCKLYRIAFTTNIAAMFANQVPIAETGIAPFADVLYFSAVQPVTNGILEQLFLTTNKGLFLLDDVDPVGTWHQVPATVTAMFAGMAGIDTLNPTTVWPFSVEDPCGFKLFDRSSIFQISGPTDDPTALTFVPSPFNAKSCSPAFESLFPITSFWSDGARRFFVINRSCEILERNRLMILPYEVNLWNVTQPAQQIITYDSFVIGAHRFFWVKQIGITGMLMAGMERGVIALE